MINDLLHKVFWAALGTGRYLSSLLRALARARGSIRCRLAYGSPTSTLLDSAKPRQATLALGMTPPKDCGSLTIEFACFIPFILVVFFFLQDVLNLFYLNSKVSDASAKLALWTSSALTESGGRPLPSPQMQMLLRVATQGALPAKLEREGEILVTTHEASPRLHQHVLWSSRQGSRVPHGALPFPASHYRTTHPHMGFVTVSVAYPYHPLQGIFSFSVAPFMLKKTSICVYRRGT